MRSLLRSLAGLTLLAGMFVFVASSDAQDKGEKVRITTVDGVTLHGMFYAGKRNAPATRRSC